MLTIKDLLGANKGATALTYGLVVGLVGIGSLAAVTRIGEGVDSLFGTTSSTLTSAVDRNETNGTASVTPTPTPLFTFSSHTFTNCSATGNQGPTQSQCRSAYNTSSQGNWDEDDSYFRISSPQGYQRWTVPQTGTYTIEVAGAANSSNEGQGYRLRADFQLDQGDNLVMVVGQQSLDSNSGGGGTFVSLNGTSTALIVAGGGAGVYSGFNSDSRIDATFQESWCDVSSSYCTTPSGFVGTNGTGGNGGGAYHGGGGGGFSSDATCNSCENAEGKGFNSTALGGNRVANNTFGGFGGGGAYHSGVNGAGAGGGYNGGRGGHRGTDPGFGGTSYVAPSGSNRSNIGPRSGHGYITITLN